MHRYCVVLLALASTAALSIAGAQGAAVSAAGGGGCSLNGSANLTPGLSSSSQSFTYTFTGSLTSCQSSSAAPASGTVEEGQRLTYSGTDSLGNPWTAIYAEPVATGSGSCASSTTSGTAVARWADGTVTVIGYSTSGAAAAVTLQGSVAASVVLNLVNRTAGTGTPPATETVATTRYTPGSDQSAAALAFQPPDPTACNTAAGVTTAGISGQVVIGSAS